MAIINSRDSSVIMQDDATGSNNNNNNEAAGVEPMDTDPIDGGPRPVTMSSNNNQQLMLFSEGDSVMDEEEAKQCIEKLRGENVAERVEAAHRLDRIATVLGEERTRRVSMVYIIPLYTEQEII